MTEQSTTETTTISTETSSRDYTGVDVRVGRPMRHDERLLLALIQDMAERTTPTRIHLQDAAATLNMTPFRARDIAHQWTQEGLYTHGGAVDYGSLTETGQTFKIHILVDEYPTPNGLEDDFDDQDDHVDEDDE